MAHATAETLAAGNAFAIGIVTGLRAELVYDWTIKHCRDDHSIQEAFRDAHRRQHDFVMAVINNEPLDMQETVT